MMTSHPRNRRYRRQEKTVLITGGSEGIGYAAASAFTRAGASNLIIISRRPEQLAEAKKGLEELNSSTKVHTFVASIDDVEKMKSIFTDVRAKIAEPDVLMLNAGRCHEPAPTLDIPVDSLWADFEINVKGNFGLVKEYLSPETLTKKKKIINVSSMLAHNIFPSGAGYGASKAALVKLLDHVQDEYADKNVYITSFHPGAVLTAMARKNGFGPSSFDWENGM